MLLHSSFVSLFAVVILIEAATGLNVRLHVSETSPNANVFGPTGRL